MENRTENALSSSNWLHLAFLFVKIPFICLKSLVGILLPNKYKDIKDDVILITGGGHGLGRQVALELALHQPKHVC